MAGFLIPDANTSGSVGVVMIGPRAATCHATTYEEPARRKELESCRLSFLASLLRTQPGQSLFVVGTQPPKTTDRCSAASRFRTARPAAAPIPIARCALHQRPLSASVCVVAPDADSVSSTVWPPRRADPVATSPRATNRSQRQIGFPSSVHLSQSRPVLVRPQASLPLVFGVGPNRRWLAEAQCLDETRRSHSPLHSNPCNSVTVDAVSKA